MGIASKVGDYAFKAYTTTLGVATTYLTATFSANVYKGLAWHNAQSKLAKEDVDELGGTPLMELMIVAGKAVPQLMLEHGLAVERVYTRSFMTSLDIDGLSISIMRADRSILQRLDAETKAPYWPVGVSVQALQG